MATDKITVATDSQGSLIIKTPEKVYNFRQPKGRDICNIYGKCKAANDLEALAIIMGELTTDKLTAEDFLDLDGKFYVELGETVMSNFRVFDKKTI